MKVINQYPDGHPVKGVVGIAVGVCLGTIIISRYFDGDVMWSKVLVTTAIAGAMSWWHVVRQRGRKALPEA